jgi:Tol biopolymer transport system component
MRATRPTLDALFDPPGWLSDINSPDADHLPFPTADGLELFFSTTRVGGVTGSDIYVATRASDQDEFGSPQSLSEINTSFREASPSLSHDGLTLFFSSDRGGASGNDIWLAERSSRDEPFGSPVAMDVVNAPSSELDPYLSIDGRELFFSSSRSGTTELWRSIRDCQ